MGKSYKNQAGFTLPELIIGVTISAVLSVAIVGVVVAWLGQYAAGSTRHTMTTDLQTALSRISTDIRGSYAVLTENAEDDPNAPPTPGNWVSNTTQLVLAKTPRDSTGSAIYESPTLFTGKPDSIVYYLRDNTLYRRVIPADYSNNVASLLNCSPQTGGCTGDTVILRNVSSLTFEYMDDEDATGATPSGTESIRVQLAASRSQSGQTLVAKDEERMSLQNLATIVPQQPPDDDDDPPPSPQTSAGLAAGPGGLTVTFANITGRDMYIKGRLNLASFGSIAISGHRMDVANIGCGTGASYPTICTGQQPIATSFLGSATASPICATAQTVTTGLTGLQIPCIAPTKVLPPFNKANFTSQMTSNVSNVNCSLFSSNHTLPANQRVDGNVTANFCNLTLQGNTYIVGNLTVGQQTKIKVAEGVTARPIIVVNGTVTMNFTTIEPNSAGVTPYIYSFYSANSGCSISDSCVTISNSELYSSVNSLTSAINIGLFSNVQASVYAYFGKTRINASNITGAVAGQQIDIGNQSGIQLTQGLWPG